MVVTLFRLPFMTDKFWDWEFETYRSPFEGTNSMWLGATPTGIVDMTCAATSPPVLTIPLSRAGRVPLIGTSAGGNET